MSRSLGFSSFIENMENKEPSKKRKERYKNRTIKKRSSKKVENFLNSMTEGLDASSISSPRDISAHVATTLGEPYDSEQLSDNEQLNKKESAKETKYDLKYHPKEVLEGFGLLKEGLEQQRKYHNNQQQYYNQNIPTYTGTPNNIPYYSQLANSQNLSGPKDDLMRKLNYVVHMLEEQQDEKTENVTEELVLYMFLGVFVIFVVDSFARAGKYTR